MEKPAPIGLDYETPQQCQSGGPKGAGCAPGVLLLIQIPWWLAAVTINWFYGTGDNVPTRSENLVLVMIIFFPSIVGSTLALWELLTMRRGRPQVEGLTTRMGRRQAESNARAFLFLAFLGAAFFWRFRCGRSYRVAKCDRKRNLKTGYQRDLTVRSRLASMCLPSDMCPSGATAEPG